MQLATFYTSAIVTKVPAKQADEFIKSIYYQIVDHYDATELFDKIIYAGNDKYDEQMEAIDKTHKSNSYAWDAEREYVFFYTIMHRNVTNSYTYSLFDNLTRVFADRIDKCAVELERVKPNNVAYDIIKKTILDINKLNIDLETKNRMMRTLDSLFEEAIFDKQKELELVKAALVYCNNRRPTIKCDKLFKENIDKYRYTGVVYHGFKSPNTHYGGINTSRLLEDYHDGFISCSKDLSIAAEFSGFDDFNEEYGSNAGLFVIEILIDDSVEAIDIENLLSDAYKNSPGQYEGLYKSYMREKEVLLKLPMVSYNILTEDEIMERLGKSKKNKWRNFKNDIDNKAVINAPVALKPMSNNI